MNAGDEEGRSTEEKCKSIFSEKCYIETHVILLPANFLMYLLVYVLVGNDFVVRFMAVILMILCSFQTLFAFIIFCGLGGPCSEKLRNCTKCCEENECLSNDKSMCCMIFCYRICYLVSFAISFSFILSVIMFGFVDGTFDNRDKYLVLSIINFVVSLCSIIAFKGVAIALYSKLYTYNITREQQNEDVNNNSDDESQRQDVNDSQMRVSSHHSQHMRYAYHVFTSIFTYLLYLNNKTTQNSNGSQNGHNSFSEESKNQAAGLSNSSRTNQKKVYRSICLGNEKCTVCQEKLANSQTEIARVHCGHVFHKECIHKWLKHHQTCPSCKERIFGRLSYATNSIEGNLPDEDNKPREIQKFFSHPKHLRHLQYIDSSRKSSDSETKKDSQNAESDEC